MGGPEWGTHVHSWLIHVNVWQKPLQYCKVISLQLKKKTKKESMKEIIVLRLYVSQIYFDFSCWSLLKDKL